MRNSFVSKTDLAQAYFPFLTPHSARNKLMSLIRSSNCDIMGKLRSIGYFDRQREFSPAQVAIITDYLGNPFT